MIFDSRKWQLIYSSGQAVVSEFHRGQFRESHFLKILFTLVNRWSPTFRTSCANNNSSEELQCFWISRRAISINIILRSSKIILRTCVAENAVSHEPIIRCLWNLYKWLFKITPKYKIYGFKSNGLEIMQTFKCWPHLNLTTEISKQFI